MKIFARIGCWFVGHSFGYWEGNRGRDRFDRFWGIRQQVCGACGAVNREMTDNILTFDRWIDEAVQLRKVMKENSAFPWVP